MRIALDSSMMVLSMSQGVAPRLPPPSSLHLYLQQVSVILITGYLYLLYWRVHHSFTPMYKCNLCKRACSSTRDAQHAVSLPLLYTLRRLLGCSTSTGRLHQRYRTVPPDDGVYVAGPSSYEQGEVRVGTSTVQ